MGSVIKHHVVGAPFWRENPEWLRTEKGRSSLSLSLLPAPSLFFLAPPLPPASLRFSPHNIDLSKQAGAYGSTGQGTLSDASGELGPLRAPSGRWALGQVSGVLWARGSCRRAAQEGVGVLRWIGWHRESAVVCARHGGKLGRGYLTSFSDGFHRTGYLCCPHYPHRGTAAQSCEVTWPRSHSCEWRSLAPMCLCAEPIPGCQDSQSIPERSHRVESGLAPVSSGDSVNLGCFRAMG